ncbi:hypothetical protein ACPA9J_25330 [Pseudomonas aeruginosa]
MANSSAGDGRTRVVSAALARSTPLSVLDPVGEHLQQGIALG